MQNLVALTVSLVETLVWSLVVVVAVVPVKAGEGMRHGH